MSENEERRDTTRDKIKVDSAKTQKMGKRHSPVLEGEVSRAGSGAQDTALISGRHCDWSKKDGELAREGWYLSTLANHSRYTTSIGPFARGVVCQRFGNPFALHHISRALRRTAISRSTPQSPRMIPTRRRGPEVRENSAALEHGASEKEADDTLTGERLHMVVDRLHGPQTSFRAAQKFLKNRTLRKMASNAGMTLYERIMAYRMLKGGDEQDTTQATSFNQNSPNKSSSAHNTESSPTSQHQRTSAIGSTHSSQGSSKSHKGTRTSSGGSGETSRRSASPSSSQQSSSMTPRRLERSDSSFGSVDISELTGLDEEKNRSPTPLPTFDDRRYGDVKNDHHGEQIHEDKATARELNDREYRTRERRTSSVLEDTVSAVAITNTRSQSSTAESREMRKVSKDSIDSTHDASSHRGHSQKEITSSNPEMSRTDKVRDGRSEESSEASQSRRNKAVPKRNKGQKNEDTIAALDRLADKNLRHLLGNDDGDDGDSDIDQETLNKIFSPQFQAELDNFLRTT